MFSSLSMRILIVAMLSGLHVLAPPTPRAEDAARAIEQRLVQWTEDFNERRLDVVCELFAPDLRSNYGDYPENTYESLCKGLHETLGDDKRTFHYELDLQDILVSGDMAAVRLVWRLTVTDKATGEAVKSSDRGLDVFLLQPDGKWRIARFLAYELDSP